MQDSIEEMSRQVVDHSLPDTLSKELQNLLISGCHRIERVRTLASTYLNRLITSFPSLMCDPPLVFAILEVLNLLQQAAANESKNEVSVHFLPKLSIEYCSLFLRGSSGLKGQESRYTFRIPLPYAKHY